MYVLHQWNMVDRYAGDTAGVRWPCQERQRAGSLSLVAMLGSLTIVGIVGILLIDYGCVFAGVLLPLTRTCSKNIQGVMFVGADHETRAYCK